MATGPRGTAPETLKALFEDAFARFGNRPALTSMGATLRYRQVERLSAAFGAFLRYRLGLAPGERVALMLPNLLQCPIALIGALRAGMVVVNFNPLHTASELHAQLADSGAAAVVVLENFAGTLEQALPGKRCATSSPRRWATPFPRRSAG